MRDAGPWTWHEVKMRIVDEIFSGRMINSDISVVGQEIGLLKCGTLHILKRSPAAPPPITGKKLTKHKSIYVNRIVNG